MILKKNKSGATLMMVVGTFAILIILMTAALSVAALAQRQTYQQYNKSQAYYIANSAINTFIEGLEKNDELNVAILGLKKGESFNSVKYDVEGAGEVQYNVKRDSNNKIVVVAKSYYANSNAQAAVILDGQLKNPKLPNFTAATVTLSASNYSEEFKATGDVMGKGVDDAFVLNNVSSIKGNVFIEGDLEVNNNIVIEPGTNKELFYIESTESIWFTNFAEVKTSDEVKKAYINTGFLKSDSSPHIGTPENPIDVYANKVELHDNVVLYGDLMLYKKDGAAPTYNAPGGWYYTHQGDLYIEGDYNQSANRMRVNGDIYVTGKLTVGTELTANNIYCNDIDVNTSNVNLTGKIYYSNSIDLGSNTVANEKVETTVEMPIRPEFNDPEEVFAPYTVTPEEFAGYINQEMFTKEIECEFGGSVEITESCTLTGNLYQNNFKITVGDEPIWIALEGDGAIVNPHKSNFTIEMSETNPDTPIFFYVPKNKTLDILDTNIVSKNTMDKINAGEIFYTGNYADPTIEITKGQPIYWFVDQGANVMVGDKAIIEGYIFSPFKNTSGHNIDITNTNGGVSMKISPSGLDDDESVMTINPKVIGAVVANQVSFSKASGIAFLTPNQSGIPGIGVGGSAASFKIEEFTRS